MNDKMGDNITFLNSLGDKIQKENKEWYDRVKELETSIIYQNQTITHQNISMIHQNKIN